MIKVTKRSWFTNKIHTLDIPLTEKEFEIGMLKRKNGALIQDAFPTLPKELREFLITGVTPEEWNNVFKLPE